MGTGTGGGGRCDLGPCGGLCGALCRHSLALISCFARRHPSGPTARERRDPTRGGNLRVSQGTRQMLFDARAEEELVGDGGYGGRWGVMGGGGGLGGVEGQGSGGEYGGCWSGKGGEG